MKRKQEDGSFIESIAKVFSAADECAAEREERMRKLEMEMEERRAEREDRREERMLSFLTRLLQPMPAGYAQGPQFHQGISYAPPAMPPYYSQQPPEHSADNNYFPTNDNTPNLNLY